MNLAYMRFRCLCTMFLVVMALRDKIKRHLKLPHGYVMEYKPHDASLRDNSSYRNTWLRG
ncbi:putative translation Initiation factor eIF-4e [Helianthus annuus]|uniref:Translation Initiation factor eIF-4e n=1 Tax=Helianthus annuus TaxID=4232 RepID=A0A9K3JQ29_HELAN|nr:putative translation Initiation factor eIF-4e [Helianthus annuus]KAJ0952931.1 putative translation Initiation factor eIF-4e [Helianthus annuus]